ncbi:MAG: acyl-CoA desaturase [Gammaproteobacteria bacterium]|nr:acyl-CoA desaturase [Gammaproteobacteria bacterium]
MSTPDVKYKQHAVVSEHTSGLERRLAYLTVGVPAIGFVAAVSIAAVAGVTWLELGLLLGMYFATACGVEAGLHRFFSHRAFRAGPVLTALLAILGSMAAQGPVLFWTATHRAHHAFTDKPGDPHSPLLHGPGFMGKLRGLWHSHIGWLFSLNHKDWIKYVPDLIRDPFVFRLNQYYFLWVVLGLLIPALLGGIIGRTWQGAGMGFLWGGLVRIFLLDQATWGVNSLAHLFGSRPHATRDNSRNLAWLAPFSVGGSWHNNHHAYPTSARNDQKIWQIDPAGWFIELMAVLGLAWDVKRYSAARPTKATPSREQK